VYLLKQSFDKILMFLLDPAVDDWNARRRLLWENLTGCPRESQVLHGNQQRPFDCLKTTQKDHKEYTLRSPIFDHKYHPLPLRLRG
jgi:hypothetical protein